MSLLPQTILPEVDPIGRVEPDGKVIIEHNWWLLLYNICQNVLGIGAGATTGLPASALTELSSADSDAMDADAIVLRSGIANAIALATSLDLPDPLTARAIGFQLYPLTKAEITAGVTPTNYAYAPYTAKRYGTVEDGSTDDAAALQACINAAQIANATPSLTPGANYKIASSLTFKQGKSNVDTQSFSAYLQGNHATLKPAAGVTAIQVVPRCLLADVGTGRAEAPIDIRDVVIDGFFATSSTYALWIGAAGYRWDSFSWSVVSNITIQNFPGTANPVMMLWEGRHCKFDRIDLRSGGTCFIQTTTSGSFCGDFVFDSCEFAGSGSQTPITIAGSGGGATRGIKFNDCDIYGGGTFLHSTGTNSQVGDIWFIGTQFDTAAGSDVFLTLYADTLNCQMFGIHIDDSYFVSGTQAIYAHTANSATMAQIDINGNQFGTLNISAAADHAAILCLDANGVSIDANTFDTITGGATTNLIMFDTCTNFTANDNMATNCTSVVNGVATANTGNNYSILGNMMNVTTIVNDGSAGATKQIANNLAI